MSVEQWQGYTTEKGVRVVKHIVDLELSNYMHDDDPLSWAREARAMVWYVSTCCQMLEYWLRCLGVAAQMAEMRRFVAESREKSRRGAW